MRRLILDLEQHDEPDGTVFDLGIHEQGAGPAAGVHHVIFGHDEKVDPPLVLDGFVLAVLTYALERVDQIIVKGPVSAKALRNTHTWAEAWHSWRPAQYHPVEIIPDAVVSEAGIRAARSPDKLGRAIAAFSGGVDATFLALRHATGMLGSASFPLDDVVLVHGFDVDLENSSAFDELLERTKPLTDALGLQVHVVRTNLRHELEQDWEDSHGAQLASILHQFSDRFGYGLVGSNEPYNHPITPWGSTPATDYLLSGGQFEVVHDGAGFSRTEKVELLASHPVARRTVKVCWAGAEQGRNCGTCEKCVRTRLNFMAVGVAAPECFDTPFDPSSISSLSGISALQVNELETILEFAERRGLRDGWIPLLRNRVAELSAGSPWVRSIPRGAATGSAQWPGSQRAPTSAEVGRLERPEQRDSRRSSESHPSMLLRERLRVHGDMVCTFIARGGPVHVLGEMAGNIGDHLIWAGTERLLRQYGVHYQKLPMSSLTQERAAWHGGTLVVPGSGAWNTFWHPFTGVVVAATKAFERVVVLPSNYDVSVPLVVDALSRPNVFAFAREAESYRQIRPLGRAALALDSALYAMPLSTLDAPSEGRRVLRSTLVALRTDKESTLEERGWRIVGETNDDISLTATNLDEFIGKIRSVDLVVTDRLHVAVAAVMLGKLVRYLDPAMAKISRYADYVFRDEFSGQLEQRDERWLAAHGYVQALDE